MRFGEWLQKNESPYYEELVEENNQKYLRATAPSIKWAAAKGSGYYDWFNNCESVIRMAAFEFAAEQLELDYDDLYYTWLGMPEKCPGRAA